MVPRSIALLGPAHPLRGGGIATYTETLAATYQKAGRRVAVFTFRYQYPKWLFPGTTQLSSEAPPAGLEIYPIIHSLLPSNWLRVAQHLQTWAPDLLLVNVWLPFFAPCLGTIVRAVQRRRPQLCSIGIVHNISPHERFPAAVALTRYILRPLDGFLALSEAVAHELRHFAPTKPFRIALHPPFEYGTAVPREEARRRLGLPAEAPIVLFFGLVRPYKGVDLLLEALPRVPVPLFTVIAGEWYIDPSPFLQRARELGIAERLRVDNRFILRNEAPLYFCAADVVVQPYRSATQSGVTPLALSYERPVIVTNVGGLAEYVEAGKTGYVVEPTPSAIADALTDFFTQNRWATFAAHLREAAHRWSWRGTVETLDALAVELFQNRQGAE
ncbi:MAG: glycosyltransferase [Candidatus Kapabacteria bacterium]|nr:glycosyltransferase [Candidatus Kapabacteria bacterium]MCS7169183.1 glycosyltransferase [Candidatus Kapabacteria bacterium]MDW7996782.1 glycosyltransferase [Bacteroidota bacterium]MDW8225485.1 glycosyltransferase [Bacteroidota bacterium]